MRVLLSTIGSRGDVQPQGCDVMVGATALQVAARLIAELMGIPYVFVAYCPVVAPRGRLTMAMQFEIRDARITAIDIVAEPDSPSCLERGLWPTIKRGEGGEDAR